MVGRLFAVIAILAFASPVRADEAKLAKARLAVDAVRYDRARTLLLAALEDGDNNPHILGEIYRLSASTALVLGEPEVAEQYYRRWLLVDPDAKLSEDTAPKLRERFEAAQAYMAAHGRLVVDLSRTNEGIRVTVVNDPLAMVAAVASDIGGTPAKTKVSDGKAFLAVPVNATIESVYVLDEYGNRLLVRPAPALPGGVRSPPPPSPPPEHRASPSMFRRGTLWLVVGGLALGGGVTTGLLARRAQTDVENIAADSGNHTLAELDDARQRRDSLALAANISFGVAGACAVLSVIMFATAPSSSGTIVPTATATTAGLSYIRSW